MENLNKLIALIKDDENTKKLRELAKIIKSNNKYYKEYNALIDLEKKYVNSAKDEDKITYENYKNEMLDNPVISEYLNALDEVNLMAFEIENILKID